MITRDEHIAELRSALRRAAGVIDQMHKSLLHGQGVVATEPNGEAVLAMAHAIGDPGEDLDRACARARSILRN